MHARVCECAKTIKKVVKIGNGALKFSSSIEALFRALHGLHAFWRQKTSLTQSDRQKYRLLVERFGMVWHALGWRVSTWVHWTVCHSSALVDRHHTIYLFSSIPTILRPIFSFCGLALFMPISAFNLKRFSFT